ncbi:Zinc finger MYM-type protein 1, partial [Aphis craccivora]
VGITIPISSATCERSFSSMRRIKNWLRTSMLQQRFTNLSILNIERDITNICTFILACNVKGNGSNNVGVWGLCPHGSMRSSLFVHPQKYWSNAPITKIQIENAKKLSFSNLTTFIKISKMFKLIKYMPHLLEVLGVQGIPGPQINS